jgi:hypothetical protein
MLSRRKVQKLVRASGQGENPFATIRIGAYRVGSALRGAIRSGPHGKAAAVVHYGECGWGDDHAGRSMKPFRECRPGFLTGSFGVPQNN